DVNPRALVHVGVAGDYRPGADGDRAGAVRVDAAAGVAGVVVADRAVVHRQRPGAVGRVLHHHPAAVGVGDVVGDHHVGQGQAGVALVADAAAGGGRAVRVGGVEGVAVLDGEPRHGHDVFGGGVVGVAGVDVEDAVEVVAVNDGRAAAGVGDGQVA